MMGKVLLCSTVFVLSFNLGLALRCFVCVDCDKDNLFEATTCSDDQDACSLLSRVDSNTGLQSSRRECVSRFMCTTGKALHGYLKTMLSSNQDMQSSGIECCYTDLCNSSESISSAPFVFLMAILLLNLV